MELLLAAALVSVVALAAFAAYGTAQNYLRDAMTMSRLQADTGLALRHLSRNLRRANALHFDAAARKLDLTVPTNPADLTQTQTLTYQFNPPQGTLVFTDGAGASQTLADHVTIFDVTATGTTAAVTLTSTSGTQTFSATSTTVVRGRQE